MALSQAKRKVVVLFDLAEEPPKNHDYTQYWNEEGWRSEKAVIRALQHLGYEPVPIGICTDIDRMIHELKSIDPVMVFNMTEAFANQRELSPQIAGVLDLLKIPYTGTRTLGLGLCQDKGLSKKILSHHRIRIPRWITSRFQNPLRGLKTFVFPAFVKPAREEASEGISRLSFVENEKDCLERVRFLHDRYESDVIVEEFIPGREFYVSVMGKKRLEVLPIRELTFREFPEDAPKFATFKTKWDEDYRKKWGIRNEFARGLTDDQTEEIHRVVKKSFEFLSLSGFARFDLRVSETGEIVVIEANPNPSLASDDDFALSAQKAGYKYEEMVEKIIEMSRN